MISNSEFAAFVGLDLDAIKMKLMHESGEGWSAARTSAVETEYRRFLYLAKAFPEEPKAPTEDVDTFWHYHILDTMKYADDCEHLFGHFLHHFPYAGMRGKADLQTLQQVGVRTAILYERTFGVRYPGIMVEATAEARASKGQAPYFLPPVKALVAGTVHAAYCFVDEPPPPPGAGTVHAAYCFVDEPPPPPGAGRVHAAYCFVDEPPPPPGAGTVRAAYCFVDEPPPPPGARQDSCSERPALVC